MDNDARKSLNDELKEATKKVSDIKKQIKALPKPEKKEKAKATISWIGKKANAATAKVNKGTPDEVSKRKKDIKESFRKTLEKIPKNVSDDDMLKVASKAIEYLATQDEPKKAKKQEEAPIAQ